MHKHPKPDPLVELGYEPDQPPLKRITSATFWFMVAVTVTFPVTWAILYLMSPESVRAKDPSSAFGRVAPPAPNPLLQTNVTTKTDIMQVRQTETTELSRVGITDKSKGWYRVDIDTALRRVPARLPVASDAREVR